MDIQTRSHRFASSRAAILATSRDVFLAHGYVDASMDTIAQRSGVSKTTLYAHFACKEALFHQIVSDLFDEHAGDAAALLDPVSAEAPAPLRSRLVAIGSRMLETLLHPDFVALMRLCIAEGPRLPRIGETAVPALRTRMVQLLTGFFRERAQAGDLAVADPEQAADSFIVLTVRDYPLLALLPGGISDAVRESMQRNVERVADQMLRLYAPAP